MKIGFSEISDWKEFENLATSYFQKLGKLKNDAIEVIVEPSGSGSDGGRDILVTIKVNDAIITFKRTWVVQCKFYKEDVKQKDLINLSIPNLIEQYGADGYLLICKNGVHEKLSSQFEQFRKNHKKAYLIWTGSEFLDKLQEHDDIIQRYFPKYFKETSKNGQIESNFVNKVKELKDELNNFLDT